LVGLNWFRIGYNGGLYILQLRVSSDRHSETKLINIIRIQEEQLLLIL
jgi:hypothetical protein